MMRGRAVLEWYKGGSDGVKGTSGRGEEELCGPEMIAGRLYEQQHLSSVVSVSV